MPMSSLEKFLANHSIQTEHPYPQMLEYFNDIVNKLCQADKDLANFIGKINIYWSENTGSCAIFASQSNNVVSCKGNPADFEWNIILNPFVLFNKREFEEGNNSQTQIKEDHIAALFAHELGHLLNHIKKYDSDERRHEINYYFINKIEETEADFRAATMLNKAGYNPHAIAEIFDILPNNWSTDFYINVFHRTQDEHMSNYERKENLELKIADEKQNEGFNLSDFKTLSPAFIKDLQEESSIRFYGIVNVQKHKLADFLHWPSFSYDSYGEERKENRYYRMIQYRLEDARKKNNENIAYIDIDYPDYDMQKVRQARGKLQQYNDFISELDSEYSKDEKQYSILEKEAFPLSKAKNLTWYRREREFHKIDFSKSDGKEKLKGIDAKYDDITANINKEIEIILSQKNKIYEHSDEIQETAIAYIREHQKDIEESCNIINNFTNDVVKLEEERRKQKREEEERRILEYLGPRYSDEANWRVKHTHFGHENDRYRIYEAVKNMRENFTIDTFFDFMNKAGSCCSLRQIKEEVLICTKGKKFFLPEDTSIPLGQIDTNIDNTSRLADMLLRVITNNIENVPYTLCALHEYENFFYHTYNKEKIQQLFPNHNLEIIDLDHAIVSLTATLFQDKNNYPTDFNQLFNLYKTTMIYKGSLSELSKIILQGEMLRGLEAIDDPDKMIAVGTDLLKERYSFTNHDFREHFFDLFSEAILEKYGKDDGTIAYKEKIEPLLETLQDREISILDRKEICEKIADTLTTKRMLSYRFEKIANIDIIGIRNEINKGLIASDILAAAKETNTSFNEEIMDFLLREFSLQSAQELRDNISSEIDTMPTPQKQKEEEWEGRKQELITKIQNISDAELYTKYTTYWNMPLEFRAVGLLKLLTRDQKDTDNLEQLTEFVFAKALPENFPQRNVIVDVISAYINAHDIEERKIFLAALMAAGKKNNETANASIAEPLKEFLENIGPAGVKIGQAIGSYAGSIPEDIVTVMQTMKDNANKPSRWQLYDMIDIAKELADFSNKEKDEQGNSYLDLHYKHISEEVKAKHEKILENYLIADEPEDNIGQVIGSGSYLVTVDFGGQVMQVMQPYAKRRAEQEFEIISRTCADTELSSKHPFFTNTVAQIAATACSMAEVETNMETAKVQHKYAQILYDIPAKNIYLGSGKRYKLVQQIAPWGQSGAVYKVLGKLEGVHFNNLPKGKLKTEIAKIYLRQELENIFSGGKFDHDRHGAQMKVSVNEEKKEIFLGLFDHGAMATELPSYESKARLGEVIEDMISDLIDNKKQITPSEAFVNALSHNLENYSENTENQSESTQYLLTVQRGLLALNDYMKEISKIDTLRIFAGSLRSSDKVIRENFSTEHKRLIKIISGADKVIDKITPILSAIKKDKSENICIIKEKEPFSVDTIEDAYLALSPTIQSKYKQKQTNTTSVTKSTTIATLPTKATKSSHKKLSGMFDTGTSTPNILPTIKNISWRA